MSKFLVPMLKEMKIKECHERAVSRLDADIDNGKIPDNKGILQPTCPSRM